MPVSLGEATKTVLKNLPGAKIQKVVEWNELFIFLVRRNEPAEENYDPYFSVNKDTGEIRDFSILTDGHGSEVVDLFMSK